MIKQISSTLLGLAVTVASVLVPMLWPSIHPALGYTLLVICLAVALISIFALVRTSRKEEVSVGNAHIKNTGAIGTLSIENSNFYSESEMPVLSNDGTIGAADFRGSNVHTQMTKEEVDRKREEWFRKRKEKQ